MKIQVCIDDLVLDFLGGVNTPAGFLDYLNARTNRQRKDRIQMSQITSYELLNHVVSEEELKESLRIFYGSHAFSNLSLMPDFLKFALLAKSANYELHAVTSRPRLLYETEKGKESVVETATLVNLDNAGISDLFEDLCFLRDDFIGDYSYVKAMYAQEQGVDLVIDHRPAVIDACIALDVKAILLTRPWNKNYVVMDGALRLDSLSHCSFSKDI